MTSLQLEPSALAPAPAAASSSGQSRGIFSEGGALLLLLAAICFWKAAPDSAPIARPLAAAPQASLYVDACLRHLLQWLGGAQTDPSSGFSHLAHARANLAILLDAESHNTLIGPDHLDPGLSVYIKRLEQLLQDQRDEE